MTCESIPPLLSIALDARHEQFDPQYEAAIRLFNGFYEGCPDLVVDLYARTLVLQNYADPPQNARNIILAANNFLLERFPWIQAVVLKTRKGETHAERRGVLILGDTSARWIRENGVRYAVDLQMNQDASFYLDTRNLRVWALENLAGKSVLNTFAYTGSLGVAAMAGGASHVMHIDRSRKFLNLAKDSYTLNGFPIDKNDFRVGDFFTQVSKLKRTGELFECVFVDPPFFSATSKGIVDLVSESQRVINKVRPLVQDDGFLVAINNALFVSGKTYLQGLELLCADGFLSIERLIPVPPDIKGYPQTIVREPPFDPAPFNHPTKIAVLRVRRKN